MENKVLKIEQTMDEDQLLLCNEEMRDAGCVTVKKEEFVASDLYTKLKESLVDFKREDTDETSVRSESLISFDITEEKHDIEMDDLKNYIETATKGISDNGDSKPIKEEFKCDDTEEIPKHELDLHESFHLFNVPEKNEIKSEEIVVSYLSVPFEDVDIKDYNATFTEGPSMETEQQSEKLSQSSTGDSELKRGKDFLYCCFHCDYSTNTRKYLRNHMVVHDKRKGKFFCANCDHSTSYKYNLVRHMSIHDERKKKSYDKEITFFCALCVMRFRSKRSLDYHIVKDHKNFLNLVSSKVHDCQTCDYKTTRKSQLRTHMISKHSESCKKHSCIGCGKQFTKKVNLDDHIIRNHQNFLHLVSRKLHNCETCDYRTTLKGNLRIHRIRIHSKNEEKFSCTCCTKQFIDKQSLDHHIIRNHPNFVNSVSSKVHSCQTCEYRTTKKNDLRQHIIRVHSKNYETHSCTGCEKQFKHKISLDDHIIQNHKNLLHLVSRKIYSCQMCEYRTTVTRNLREHKKRTHSENDKKQ